MSPASPLKDLPAPLSPARLHPASGRTDRAARMQCRKKWDPGGKNWDSLEKGKT